MKYFALTALVLASVPTLVGSTAHASFDWGSACDGVRGEFEQRIRKGESVEVGKIPAGKKEVRISLESNRDVDIQLVTENGEEIVAWPDGLLNGPTAGSTTHNGVEYIYSGYDGVDGKKGHEYIKVAGLTGEPLVMKAFGYKSGKAKVAYSSDAIEDCVDAGSGSFEQEIEKDAVITVGDIPAGKKNVQVFLTGKEGKDVDIQLYDGDAPIVAWPKGLLNGDKQESIEWEGVRVTYSGYDGRLGDKGREDITIVGTLPKTLTMKVFGYAAGYADVSYNWGGGQKGDSCGGHTPFPRIPCDEGLACQYRPGMFDGPGTCWPEVGALDDACGGKGFPRNPKCGEGLSCFKLDSEAGATVEGLCRPEGERAYGMGCGVLRCGPGLDCEARDMPPGMHSTLWGTCKMAEGETCNEDFLCSKEFSCQEGVCGS